MMSKILINYPKYLLLSVIFIIFSALILEYFFDMSPCKLCKFQRIPYYMIITLGIFNFCSGGKCNRSFMILSSILLFSVSIIAFYHAGIEYGFFENIFNCESSKNDFSNTRELKNHLLNKINKPCNIPAFKFIFTLSGWNFIIATILGFTTIKSLMIKK